MKSLPGRNALWIAVGLFTLAVPGCGNKLHSLLRPAAPPVASLRVVRLPATAAGAAFEASWSASPAGRPIDHYLIAIDPHTLELTDPAWQPTRETRRSLAFPAPATRPGVAGAADAEPDEHVFALRAVDAGGAVSEVVWRQLGLENIPPNVHIVSPQPSAFFYATVPPSVHVTWTGSDPDGQSSQRPVKYKYRLFKDTDAVFGEEPPNGTDQFDLARANPDSLRRFYAPAFAGWDSVPGGSTSVQYLNLVPNSRYLFVVVAFDEAGDSNPTFSLNSNMLQLRVSF